MPAPIPQTLQDLISNETEILTIYANRIIPSLPCNILIDDEVMIVIKMKGQPNPDIWRLTVTRSSPVPHSHGAKILASFLPFTSVTTNKLDAFFAAKVRFKQDTDYYLNTLLLDLGTLEFSQTQLEASYFAKTVIAEKAANVAADAVDADLRATGTLSQATLDLITDAGTKRTTADSFLTDTVIPGRDAVRTKKDELATFQGLLQADQAAIKIALQDVNDSAAGEIFATNAGSGLVNQIKIAYNTLTEETKVLTSYFYNDTITFNRGEPPVVLPVFFNQSRIDVTLIFDDILKVGPLVGKALNFLQHSSEGGPFSYNMELTPQSAPSLGIAKLGEKVSLVP